MCKIPDDFFANIIIQTIGSLIGVGGAVLIFIRQLRIDKGRKAKDDQNFKKDKLMYQYILARNILSISVQHQSSFSALSANYRDAPFNHHLLPTTAIYEFKRLTDKLNVEDYFLSYISLMPNTQDSAITFSELMNRCETAAFTIEDAIRFHKERATTIYDLKMEFKKSYKAAAEIISGAMVLAEYKADTNLKENWQRFLAEKSANPTGVDSVFWTYKKLVEPMLILIHSDVRYKYGSLAESLRPLHSCADIFHEIESYGPVTSKTFHDFATGLKNTTNDLINKLRPLDSFLRQKGLEYKELPSGIA